MNDWLSSWSRVLSLSDYNTRVVLCGTTLLGIAAGLTGVYLLLRKRALLGDAISHATLPGVAGVFLWSVAAGVPKSLTLLLIGAAVTGSLGGLCVLGLRHAVKIREDAALGIVLSVFFGVGIALLGIVQKLQGGNAAGLESFIYGKAASMTWNDSVLIGSVTAVVLIIVGLFQKELKILCFDTELARSQGWPVLALDFLLIAMIVTVTIVGLKAVGLILVIALLIVPAAAARFWSHRLRTILILSAAIGGVSCGVGTLMSAAGDNLPSGPMIVLAACSLFIFSFGFGKERGCVWDWLRHATLTRQHHIQHLLRMAYEQLEAAGKLNDAASSRPTETVPLARIAATRAWSISFTRRTAARAERQGLATSLPDQSLRLTPRGFVTARRIVRDHRLLEHFFLDQVQVSEGGADLGADYLEHALMPELAWQLEGQLEGRIPSDSPSGLPSSPHRIEAAVGEDLADHSAKKEMTESTEKSGD
ncbi:MAG: iron chelate uptake ABC transporter family permease subunit [Pirellulales bacterium]